MAYGTPASTDDIEAYYTHIRRGRAPTPEQPAELTARYTAIGGDRKSVAAGKSASVRVDLGCRRIVKEQTKHPDPSPTLNLPTLQPISHNCHSTTTSINT